MQGALKMRQLSMQLQRKDQFETGASAADTKWTSCTRAQYLKAESIAGADVLIHDAGV